MDIDALLKEATKRLGNTTITFDTLELSSVLTGLVGLIADAPDDMKDHPMLRGAKAAGRKIEAAVNKGPSPYSEYFEED